MRIYVDGGTHKSRICVVDQSNNFENVKTRKGNPTNNELEYLALLYALSYIHTAKIHARQIIILTDSKLMANQMNDKWRITNEKLAKLNGKCKRMMLPNIRIKWISRKRNKAGFILDKMKQMDYYKAQQYSPKIILLEYCNV